MINQVICQSTWSIKIWGKMGETAGKYVFRSLTSSQVDKFDISWRGAETLKSFEDVVNNVFIMPQVFLDRVFFKKVQFKDTTFRPVDPGLDDPDSFPMVNLYRRIVNKSNLNKRER